MNLAVASWLLSAFAVVGAAAGIAIGLAADHIGARRMAVGGLAVQGVCSAIGALSDGAAMLLATRVLEGFGFLAVTVAAPALIAQATPQSTRDRAFALPADVNALAGRIAKDFGAIDILVNDIWGGELLKGGPSEWNTPIWQHDLDKGLRILRLAIDTHLITSKYLLRLLIHKPGGLLVEVTDGTNEYNASTYRISVYYDLAKVAVNRLVFSEGHELAPHGATAVVAQR
jgi:NAD(P)-dependent dehydrogenase (short-subunit alcohol dehydrogenase family)